MGIVVTIALRFILAVDPSIQDIVLSNSCRSDTSTSPGEAPGR